MILGFKEQFIPKIIEGTKIHTLREGERWREDMSIQFYGNVRTKEMYKFREDGVCTGVNTVLIWLSWGTISIKVGNKFLLLKEQMDFIKNDGFNTEQDFIEYFFPDKPAKKAIRLQLVHWTDFRY